jgi:hypothetical protein
MRMQIGREGSSQLKQGIRDKKRAKGGILELCIP